MTRAPLVSSRPRPTVRNKRFVKLLVLSEGVIRVDWISAPSPNMSTATMGSAA